MAIAHKEQQLFPRFGKGMVVDDGVFCVKELVIEVQKGFVLFCIRSVGLDVEQ